MAQHLSTQQSTLGLHRHTLEREEKSRHLPHRLRHIIDVITSDTRRIHPPIRPIGHVIRHGREIDAERLHATAVLPIRRRHSPRIRRRSFGFGQPVTTALE